MSFSDVVGLQLNSSIHGFKAFALVPPLCHLIKFETGINNLFFFLGEQGDKDHKLVGTKEVDLILLS